MKIRLVIYCCLIFSSQAGTYRSLSNADKKDFIKSYRAVKESYSKHNFAPVIQFSPELIERFESIMMDPQCKKLRPLYEEMINIHSSVCKSKAIDSLEAIISSYRKSGDHQKMLLILDQFLPTIALLDSSKYRNHKAFYDSLIENVSKEKSMSTYSFIASLRYSNHEQLHSFQLTLHDKFDDKIAQLSANLNADSLKQFQISYPGVRTADITALLDRSRVFMKQSILRQPSIQEFFRFKSIFGNDKLLQNAIKKHVFKLSLYPNPDPAALKEYLKLFPEEEQTVWATFEDSLFSFWNSTRDPTKAQNYLRFYPEGRYSSIIISSNQPLRPIITNRTYQPSYEPYPK